MTSLFPCLWVAIPIAIHPLPGTAVLGSGIANSDLRSFNKAAAHPLSKTQGRVS